MFFQRIKTPGLGHNAYLMDCGDGQAVLVDPRRDVDEYLQRARDNDLTIAYVLHTHRQEDFEFGSATVAERTGAKIVAGKHELSGQADCLLAHGEELKVANTRFVALATPGHTPESTSYAAYVKDSGDVCWAVFTGDTLFVGDTGRTDLSDAEKTAEHAKQLYDSVHRHIGPLGDQALLFPAHGSGSACGGNISSRDDSTLGIERATNPVFTKSRNGFTQYKLAEKMARPPYFRHMEEVNLRGGRPLVLPPACRVLQPAELQQRMANDGVVVLDTRDPEAFAGSHIPGTYNLWLAGMPAFGGWIASHRTPILLIVEGKEALDTALRSLARIGIDSVDGALTSGVQTWREQGFPVESIETVGAAQARQRLQQGAARVLDVREAYEWDERHIPGAMHQFVGDLEHHLPQIAKDTELIVHCSVGHRSGLAVSILRRNGFTRPVNMLGGITAWDKLKLPVERTGQPCS